jgi:hypothetical protein
MPDISIVIEGYTRYFESLGGYARYFESLEGYGRYLPLFNSSVHDFGN